ncbi:MAG: protein phosphatase 2C domain-containing protein [Dehalococcoidia bacterium]
MRLHVGASTSAGQLRADNQDFLLYRIASLEPDAARDCSLFVAADGVGGAAGGAIASEVTAETIAARFPRRGGADPAAAMIRAIRAAERAVAERASVDPALSEMATTLVVAVVRDNTLLMANVGDSRGYLIRGSEARRITEDHSFVEEEVRAGRMSAAAAAVSPYRHVITRSINGVDEDVEVDIFGPLPLELGDRILLCTDGLTETMADDEIAGLAQPDDAEAAAQALVDEANRRGGPDNVSVLLVAVVDEDR